MITNKDDTKLVKNKNKEAISELEKHLNNLKVVRTFQMSSTSSLQFVVTKTFLNMLDTVGKTFSLSSDESVSEYDEKDDFELDEALIIENLRNKQTEKQLVARQVEQVEPDEDDEEENFSFSFLIKNELGCEINLESLYGFKVNLYNLIQIFIPLNLIF